MINKIGLQLYSVRTHFDTPDNAAKTFKKLKELGYDEVQTAGCYGMDYADFYQLANDAGIEIIGTHDNYSMMKYNIEKSIENHKKLHTKYMGIGGFRAGTEEEVRGFILYANEIADRISKEGMKFTYHNHSHEFVKFDSGKTAMEMLIEGLNPNTTSFCFDTYWAQNAGCDVCTWLEKLKGRVDIIHLKDMKMHKDEDGRIVSGITMVGDGNMDFNKIIKKAEEIGVKHYCVEQDNCPVDFEESLKFSSDYLHKNFMTGM